MNKDNILEITDLTLSNNYVLENEPVGSTVGSFKTVDPNVGNFHVYRLVSGVGGADNNKLKIFFMNLLTTEEFNFELKNIY